MYAIIRTGGKQAKVREGDVIDVERLHSEGEVTFTPLLLIDDKGAVTSGREELRGAKVTARVVGATAGDKIEMFKYKAKTGYRLRGGHRQKYTRIEVLKIEGPKAGGAKTVTKATRPAPEAAPAAAGVDVAAGAAALGRKLVMDDLEVVEGIGPKIAEILRGAGIATWKQLAAADPAEIRATLEAAGPRFTAHDPGTWPQQAGLLAAGSWDEFKALAERLDGGKVRSGDGAADKNTTTPAAKKPKGEEG